MASSKKSTKTNKTAHVLNVITGGHGQSDPVEEQAPAPASDPAVDSQAPTSRPPVTPILEIARADDDALSAAILNTLMEEVTGESTVATPEEAPTPQAPIGEAVEPDEIAWAVASVEESAPAASAPAEAVHQPEPVQADTAPQSEPVQVDTTPQPEPAPAPAEPELSAEEAADAAANDDHYESNKDVVYHNITQALVEDKAEKYMKMTGMCCCPRCMADVKALALSNLPPKYIVMHKTALTPMLSYYEGRFGAAITAQIFSACQLVKENPRH